MMYYQRITGGKVKRTAFLKHLAEYDCILVRHGANEDIYRNQNTGAQSSVPRHREIKNLTVRKICKELGIPPMR